MRTASYYTTTVWAVKSFRTACPQAGRLYKKVETQDKLYGRPWSVWSVLLENPPAGDYC